MRTYRPYVPGDDDAAVLKLRTSVWGAAHRHTNEAFLRWLYADCPAGRGSGIVMFDGDEAVGFAGLLARLALIGGETVPIAQCVDYMVHSDVRGGAMLPLPVPLSVGGTVAVVVAGDATFVQFLPVEGGQFAAAGQVALKVVNTVKSTSLDIYLTPAGGTLATPAIAGAVQGTLPSFTQVLPGTFDVKATTAGTKQVVADLGSMTLAAGETYTIVIGPAAASGSLHRFFTLKPADFC